MNKKNTVKSKKNNSPIIIISVIFLVALISIFISNIVGNSSKEGSASNSNTESSAIVTTDTDLKILKSEVTKVAKIYPYKAGNVYMELLAVKAKDGSIRTALNTCQVCYASGKGYYKQNGDTVVCQNCGNVFDIDQIGKAKNGCNPVPVENSYKKDDGTNIIVSKAFMDENKSLFLRWKKQ